MPEWKHVTIQVVADAAGVSTATVSRVLAGLPGAGEETRKRVLRAAEELNFRGDPSAKMLRSRKSNSYGMVVPDLRNPFFPELIHSLEHRAQHHGRVLFISNSQNDTETELRRVEALVDRRVDGLLISPVDRRESVSTIRWAAERVRVVQLDRHAGTDAPYVGADHAATIRKVVTYLKGTGRERLAYVGFPDSSSTSKERIDAFTASATSESISVARIETGLPTTTARAIAAWIDQNPRQVEAIITTSDLHGIATKFELQALGIRVPEDVAIVSFDNTSLAAAADLTSVQQPVDLIAEKAIELIEGTDVAGDTIVISGHIVPRGSSAVR